MNRTYQNHLNVVAVAQSFVVLVMTVALAITLASPNDELLVRVMM